MSAAGSRGGARRLLLRMQLVSEEGPDELTESVELQDIEVIRNHLGEVVLHSGRRERVGEVPGLLYGDHATILDDPGARQVMLSVGWVPAVVVTAFGAIVVALVTWDLLTFPIVLAAGALLGWLLTGGLPFAMDEYHYRRGLGEAVAETLFIADLALVGPLVACAVAAVVTALWR